MKRVTYFIFIVTLTLLPLAAFAGNLDSPGNPTSTAGHLPTLEELHEYLTSGTTPGAAEPFQEPAAGPGSTMYTLQTIYDAINNLFDQCAITPDKVLSNGQKFFSTIGTWGPTEGTMPDNGAVTITPGTSAQTIAAGYHNGSGTVEGDADLIADNIKSGVEIFGVAGTFSAENTYNTGVSKTGQTTCYDAVGAVISCAGTGQDGDLQKGVTWPNPRFTNNGDGTVTDNLTGLIWLQKANCIHAEYPGFDTDGTTGDGEVTWQHALDFVAGMNAGTYSNCGGTYTDWRLPNKKELLSLIYFGVYNPALSDTAGTGPWSEGDPFSDVQLNYYWSSTTYAGNPDQAWIVQLRRGDVLAIDKLQDREELWPVRGGE